MERSAASATLIFRFGLYEADVARNTLTRSGVRVKIQDQPFRVLTLLLERAGEIVSRDELRQQLWPEGTYVDFDGSLNVILKKLRATLGDDSDNPRFIETVPKRGYRFLAPVSVANQHVTDAPAPADPVVNLAPTQLPAGTVVLPVVVPARSAIARPLYITAAIGILVAGTLGGLLLRDELRATRATATAQAGKAVPLRRAVAVLGFYNASPRNQDAWLGTALSEMLSTELSAGDSLRLVSGEDVANLRLSSPWPESDSLDQQTTTRLGNALNTDLLVLGSYAVVSHHLRVDARLQDVKTGEILSEVAETGSPDDIFRLVSGIGGRLRERLGISSPEGTAEAGVLAALPLNPAAARLYALGVQKLRTFEPLPAKDLLEQATEADPKFALGHAMLARAWGQLGYDQERRQEVKEAFDLSTDLPPAARMLVEGDYYASVGNLEKAASVYRALFELFPDDVEYGLQLAAADTVAGHGTQALETLRRLRALPPPSSSDPRIDLQEATLTMRKNAAVALIENAASKAWAQSKKLVYAQARRDECVTTGYTDHPQGAAAYCEEAYNIFLSAGNRVGAADSIRALADLEGTQGRFDEAIATYQRALAVLEGTGEHTKTGAILNNMAIVFADQGNLDRAEQLYRQAKSNFEQAGNKANVATAIGNIADILYLRGDLAGAENQYQQALQLESSLDPSHPGYLLSRLADLDLTRGRIRDARRQAEAAIAAFQQEQGSYQYLTGAMTTLGQALEAQADLPGARDQYQRSLEVRQRLGAQDLVAENQLNLAEIELRQSNPQKAEELLRDAIREFEKEKADPDASSAYTLLTRALLAQGKIDEARQAVQRAVEFSRTSSDPALKLPAAIEMARVASAAPERKSVPVDLNSTIAKAKKLGYYQFECEARMAMGEWQMKANAATGRSQLMSLATEARNHGLELLARQAEQLASSTPNVVAEKR